MVEEMERFKRRRRLVLRSKRMLALGSKKSRRRGAERGMRRGFKHTTAPHRDVQLGPNRHDIATQHSTTHIIQHTTHHCKH